MDERNDPQMPPEGSEGVPPTNPTPVAGVTPADDATQDERPTIGMPPVGGAQSPDAAASSWVPGAAAEEGDTASIPVASAADAEDVTAPDRARPGRRPDAPFDAAVRPTGRGCRDLRRAGRCRW